MVIRLSTFLIFLTSIKAANAGHDTDGKATDKAYNYYRIIASTETEAKCTGDLDDHDHEDDDHK